MHKKATYEQLEKRIRELEEAELERKQHEEYLGKYRDIVSSTTDGIALIDKNYRYIIVNDSYEKFSGQKAEQFRGSTVAENLGEHFFERFVKPKFDKCMRGETVNYQEWFDYPLLGKRYADITYFPYRDNNDLIVGVIANTRDITERKQAEDALIENEERLRLALDGSGVSFWEYFVESDRYFYDDNWEKFIGFSSEETCFNQQWWRERVHPDSIPIISKAESDYLEGRTPRYEAEYQMKIGSGEWKWIGCAGVIVEWDKQNNPIRVLGTHKDITERKQIEQDRERLISELQDALAEVRILSGLLPICSHCKKIRDDKGYWNQIESYISKHSEAKFSHGLCPECISTLYPDLDIHHK